jgi:hypothetical protein
MNRVVVGTLLACGLTVSTAQAALIDRGGGMIYDDVLNITWLQDANYAYASGYDPRGGRMTWENAMEWAENLVYGGFDDWRLPTVRPIGSDFNTEISNNGTTDSGYGNRSPSSEMAYMYYVNLGNLGFCTPNDSAPSGCEPQRGFGPRRTAPFTNLQNWIYWSGTEFEVNPSAAWFFAPNTGFQYLNFKLYEFYAWAVRSGDVASPVREPSALALLGLGLAGLGLSRRRKGVHATRSTRQRVRPSTSCSSGPCRES